jgi:SpoVK/Ycf46/Vps4 family AAA+-type ATPase
MGRLVTVIEAAASLDQLVAPRTVRAQIRDIVGWHRVADRVQREMGLGASARLGHGLTCLFSGPPGTGKTFAARCVAAALGLNLYRIDLSQVVSKYIGETEKALAQVFDEAEAGHGVLFFDEADALFGKRSEVKDAHDRYANIEVGYLLQRIETYDGVLILATNLRNNIDPAFLRRIQFLVDFPMPDAPARHRLWDQALPGAAHRAPDLDLEGFAERFRLAGGNIDSIARAAAHLAAAEDGKIAPEHLARATYRELEKIGQARARGDFGALAQHLPEDTWAAASR